MENKIRIPMSVAPEDFIIIKNLIIEWNWADSIKYDVILSSEDENTQVTFYIDKEDLGEFISSIFHMGKESVFRQPSSGSY